MSLNQSPERRVDISAHSSSVSYKSQPLEASLLFADRQMHRPSGNTFNGMSLSLKKEFGPRSSTAEPLGHHGTFNESRTEGQCRRTPCLWGPRVVKIPETEEDAGAGGGALGQQGCQFHKMRRALGADGGTPHNSVRLFNATEPQVGEFMLSVSNNNKKNGENSRERELRWMTPMEGQTVRVGQGLPETGESQCRDRDTARALRVLVRCQP